MRKANRLIGGLAREILSVGAAPALENDSIANTVQGD